MAENTKEFNQIEYQNKYIKEKYDRVGLTMPKGKKEVIKARALEEGISINEYINALVFSGVGISRPFSSLTSI